MCWVCPSWGVIPAWTSFEMANQGGCLAAQPRLPHLYLHAHKTHTDGPERVTMMLMVEIIGLT
jgi:hypothetical protein